MLRPPTRAEAVDWLNEYILRDDHSLQERLVLRKLRVEQVGLVVITQVVPVELCPSHRSAELLDAVPL